MTDLAKIIEKIVCEAIEKFEDTFECSEKYSCFDEVISMAELIDRLSIVNYKLYCLKNEVAKRQDVDFCAWAAKEDIYLCRERSRLKNCINSKLITMIQRTTSGYNLESDCVHETKLYD